MIAQICLLRLWVRVPRGLPSHGVSCGRPVAMTLPWWDSRRGRSTPICGEQYSVSKVRRSELVGRTSPRPVENSARRDVVLVLEGHDVAESVGDAAADLDVADPFALVAAGQRLHSPSHCCRPPTFNRGCARSDATGLSLWVRALLRHLGRKLIELLIFGHSWPRPPPGPSDLFG